jgi:hypothetical protein
VREFAFELAACASLEAESDGIIARQLGTRGRIVDIVEVRPGPAFDRRMEITPETIPPLAIESDVGVGTARRPSAAIDADPDRASAIADRAIEVGFFEAERRGGQRLVRQATRYPAWIDELRAFENKPDLDRPGELELQLRKDVSLSLFEEVVLLTESHVTGAHLNRIPDPVGVWHFDPETGAFETIREARTLPTDEPGLAVLEERPARIDVEPIDAARKHRLRRRIAERAHGKGWRPESLPNCERAEPRGAAFDEGTDALPYCAWKGRFVDRPRECTPDCDGHAPTESPEIDVESIRDRRTPWIADPTGVERHQIGLDRFSG